MATVCYCNNFRSPPASTVRVSRKLYGVRCSSSDEKRRTTPQFLKVVISGITEALRLFSNFNRCKIISSDKREERAVSNIDDVIMILKSDYANSYFVTGIFTSSVYTEDCIFEDPTIKFTGTELYKRNLKLLVPFFDDPSISLQQIEKASNGEEDYIYATWKLRTYLKLPWRPLISIDGNTVYELDNKYKIVRHAESWSVSAWEAVAQIFTAGSGGENNTG